MDRLYEEYAPLLSAKKWDKVLEVIAGADRLATRHIMHKARSRLMP